MVVSTSLVRRRRISNPSLFNLPAPPQVIDRLVPSPTTESPQITPKGGIFSDVADIGVGGEAILSKKPIRYPPAPTLGIKLKSEDDD